MRIRHSGGKIVWWFKAAWTWRSDRVTKSGNTYRTLNNFYLPSLIASDVSDVSTLPHSEWFYCLLSAYIPLFHVSSLLQSKGPPQLEMHVWCVQNPRRNVLQPGQQTLVLATKQPRQRRPIPTRVPCHRLRHLEISCSPTRAHRIHLWTVLCLTRTQAHLSHLRFHLLWSQNQVHPLHFCLSHRHPSVPPHQLGNLKGLPRVTRSQQAQIRVCYPGLWYCSLMIGSSSSNPCIK